MKGDGTKIQDEMVVMVASDQDSPTLKKKNSILYPTHARTAHNRSSDGITVQARTS
jgi:hypothetical protein